MDEKSNGQAQELTSEQLAVQEKLTELEILKQSVEEKKKLAEGYYDQLLRLEAEFENYRKRVEKERTDLIKFAQEPLILNLLSLMDNIERALKAAKSSDNFKVLLQGLELIHKEFRNLLKQEGVHEIKSIGEKLDPLKHHVAGHEESTKHKDDEIIEELQKGYILKDRVIRPAIVKVAKKIEEHE